jgi:hypothetical protein
MRQKMKPKKKAGSYMVKNKNKVKSRGEIEQAVENAVAKEMTSYFLADISAFSKKFAEAMAGKAVIFVHGGAAIHEMLGDQALLEFIGYLYESDDELLSAVAREGYHVNDIDFSVVTLKPNKDDDCTTMKACMRTLVYKTLGELVSNLRKNIHNRFVGDLYLLPHLLQKASKNSKTQIFAVNGAHVYREPISKDKTKVTQKKSQLGSMIRCDSGNMIPTSSSSENQKDTSSAKQNDTSQENKNQKAELSCYPLQDSYNFGIKSKIPFDETSSHAFSLVRLGLACNYETESQVKQIAVYFLDVSVKMRDDVIYKTKDAVKTLHEFVDDRLSKKLQDPNFMPYADLAYLFEATVTQLLSHNLDAENVELTEDERKTFLNKAVRMRRRILLLVLVHTFVEWKSKRGFLLANDDPAASFRRVCRRMTNEENARNIMTRIIDEISFYDENMKSSFVTLIMPIVLVELGQFGLSLKTLLKNVSKSKFHVDSQISNSIPDIFVKKCGRPHTAAPAESCPTTL